MEAPHLGSFELSEAQYRAAKRASDNVIGVILVMVFAGAVVGMVLSTGLTIRDGFGAIMGTLFGGILIAGYPLAIAIPVTLWVVPALFRKTSRNFRNAEAFERAEKEFMQWRVRTEKQFWLKLSGLEFEREVASLFSRHGHHATLTPATADGGVDIWISEPDGKVIVQCKAHAKPIGPSVARELYGTLKHFQAKRAVLVSRSGFTPGVENYTRGKPIDLLSLEHLIKLQRNSSDGL